MSGVAEIINALAHLAWPFVFWWLAVVYKPEILLFLPSALQRKFKLAVAGVVTVEMDALEQQPKIASKIEAESGVIELKEIPGLTRTPAMARLELELHAQLKNITAEPVDVLVRNLAQARLEAAFGKIYARIFGSQIQGLIELRARRKVSTADSIGFYEQYEKANPEFYKGYGFPGWIGFLRNTGLITQTTDDVVITEQGDDFLIWLEATKLPPNKPG
jgi:hypothetical protein